MTTFKKQDVLLSIIYNADEQDAPKDWSWDLLVEDATVEVLYATPVIEDEHTARTQAEFDDNYDPTPSNRWEVTEGRDVSETPNYVEAHNI